MTERTLSEIERENADLVTRFCNTWAERNVEALLPFIADDIFYQMWDSEGAIIVNGKAEFAETLGPFFESTTRISFEILRTQAMGKVVTNERYDTFVFDGGAEWFFPIVGVFIIENGKIQYWKDFVTPTKATRM